MKYMLMMNTPRDGYTQYLSWPKETLEANTAFMQSFTQKLADAGELVATQGLAAPEQARLVRAGKDGMPITDGVFPEAKEFLAGFWIVDVASAERALQVAAEASTAPGAEVRGADGKPIQHLWIEVREVLECHKDL
jgi:hypothetical protein